MGHRPSLFPSRRHTGKFIYSDALHLLHLKCRAQNVIVPECNKRTWIPFSCYYSKSNTKYRIPSTQMTLLPFNSSQRWVFWITAIMAINYTQNISYAVNDAHSKPQWPHFENVQIYSSPRKLSWQSLQHTSTHSHWQCFVHGTLHIHVSRGERWHKKVAATA